MASLSRGKVRLILRNGRSIANIVQQQDRPSAAEDSSFSSASGPFAGDYSTEHQQQSDPQDAEHYAHTNGDGGYYDQHQGHEGYNEQDVYSQQGLFDEERPPEDGDMW